jgi:hypothetical protein
MNLIPSEKVPKGGEEMGALWLLIPDEALVLVIAAIGLGLILRLISGRTAAAVLGMLVLLLVLAPAAEVLFASLPSWVGILILVAIAGSLLRLFLALFLGTRAAAHTVGILAADAIRFAVLLPFRIVGWIFRR